MEVTNTLAYYVKAKFAAVKSFIVHILGVLMQEKAELKAGLCWVAQW
jgi:hypothetical protein